MPTANLIYFSPALSTQKIVQLIGKATAMSVAEHNITQGLAKPLMLERNNLAIIGVPVYAGRVPAAAAEALSRLKGQQTPTAVVCVYGNRAYDDALLELVHICKGNGMEVIAAGAFIARHSIFPTVAEGRPDENDMALITNFGERCASEYLKTLKGRTDKAISVSGRQPYKAATKIPLKPKTSRKCTICGTCVGQCPVNAIATDNPRKTHKSLCISCTRCMVVCPENARSFKGLIYRIANKKFRSAYSVRKEPELFFRS